MTKFQYFLWAAESLLKSVLGSFKGDVFRATVYTVCLAFSIVACYWAIK